MSLLSNFDINDICKYLELPLIGVIMKDKLPNSKNAPIGYYVINMESSSDGGSGSHWVCLCNIPDRRFYYDSFGNGPPQLVEKFMKGNKYFINSTRLQYENSEFCGWYCIAIMYYTNYFQPNANSNSNIETRINTWNRYYYKKNYKGNYKKMIKYFDSIYNHHNKNKLN